MEGVKKLGLRKINSVYFNCELLNLMQKCLWVDVQDQSFEAEIS